MDESAREVRVSLTGLLGFAAVEEEVLLSGVDGCDEVGDPDAWAALPTVAHISEFRNEQVKRLVAIRTDSEPPGFRRIDHESAEDYGRYCKFDARSVRELSRASSRALIDETCRCSDEDLFDPSRNPWLRGRHLWLQIIVRGFWHPVGHLGDYYLSHAMPERALALHAHAATTLQYLKGPRVAMGMVRYSLACTQALIGQEDDAVASLGLAVEANPDLREHATRDRDLAGLRERGRLTTVLF
jgi:hypothetical protein